MESRNSKTDRTAFILLILDCMGKTEAEQQQAIEEYLKRDRRETYDYSNCYYSVKGRRSGYRW